MNVTGQGIKDGAIGVGILAAIGIGGYLVYELIKGAGWFGDELNTAGEAVGGAIYTAINGDANVDVQTTFQKEKSALAAAGNPAVGTDAYNTIIESFGGTP